MFTGAEYTISAWQKRFVDSGADLALIIAPEIDGILQQAITSFQANRVPTLNCSGAFLSRTCDKWLTALNLENSGVAHPSTQLASDWSGSTKQSSEQVCLKARLGAGCEGMWIGSCEDLILKIDSLSNPTSWIVQSWLEGTAFSCSAIVDRQGNATWLPLATQCFEILSLGKSQMLRYQGGMIVDPSSGPPRPDELLTDLLSTLCSANGEALGWVGVDLLLQPNGRWVVIEVNPRLTTSILGLSQAAPYNLAESMVEAYTGIEIASSRAARGKWQIVEFTTASS
jgi:predicted ATP-grasp superfamily ATP-dependent carboligase